MCLNITFYVSDNNDLQSEKTKIIIQKTHNNE